MTVYKPTKEELAVILTNHRKWLLNEEGGKRAYLSGAYLSRANLSGADLSGAYLSDANLSRANLSGANLSRANLSDADLSGADLSGADLSGAYLSDANLSRANLSGAYLSRANLSDADLSGADLSGAYLSRANLSDADLSGADLSGARDDFRKVLDAAPAEVPQLLATLREGRVDGSCYEGECACLVGTIANVRGCNYNAIPGLVPDSFRPAERLFLAIQKGHTPENNPIAKIVEGWIVEWQGEQAAAVPK